MTTYSLVDIFNYSKGQLTNIIGEELDINFSRKLVINKLLEEDKLDEAEAASLKALSGCRSKTSEHNIPYYTLCLARVEFRRGRWERLRHWASAGEQYYGKMGGEHSNVALLMWHAVALLKTESPREARRAYARANRAGRAQCGNNSIGYHIGKCAFLEESGHLEAALCAQQQAINSRVGATNFECQRRLDRLRLLRRLGRPINDELAILKDLASKLKDPSRILDQIA